MTLYLIYIGYASIVEWREICHNKDTINPLRI